MILVAFATSSFGEIRETYGIFDCVFMEQGETKTLDGYTNPISSSSSWTIEQKSSIQRSLDTWMSLIDNTAGRQLTALFTWSDNLGENVLGGSNSGYSLFASDNVNPLTWNLSPVEAIWQQGVNWDAEGRFDIVIQFASNFIPAFYFGTEANIGTFIDFQSVMTHELGHNIGFSSFSSPITQTTGSWPYRDQDGNPVLTQFDGLMSQNGQNPIENNTFPLGGTIDVGGGDLTVYNPASWEGGSSMSHIDPASDPDALMNPGIGYGTVKRTPSINELRLMEEMGWNINWAAAGIPEPSSSALLLLTGTLFLIRRNRKEMRA